MGAARRAAGADAGDDVDDDVVVAPVAAAVVVVEVVVGAAVLAAVLADVAVAAGAGLMMHKAKGECWVQQASIVLLVAEVVAAAVVGGGYETAWFAMMSCASGRIVAAGLVHGLGKVAAKTAGESQIALVGTSSIGVGSRAMNVAFGLVEVSRTSSL